MDNSLGFLRVVPGMRAYSGQNNFNPLRKKLTARLSANTIKTIGLLVRRSLAKFQFSQRYLFIKSKFSKKNIGVKE